MVYAVEDNRRPNWLNTALPTGLPAGDSILVVDIDLDTTAVEVGTASPNHAMHLVSLQSIVPESSREFMCSERLTSAQKEESSDARAWELEDLLKSPELTPLQRVRLEFLYDQERRGVATGEWWKALGADCVVSDIPNLRDLEGKRAAACAEYLMEVALQSAPDNAEISHELLTFIRSCKSKSANSIGTEVVAQRERRLSIIDRESETQELCNCLEAEGAHILEITGLTQIGKSEIVNRSITQYGARSVKIIELSATCSADFILGELLRLGEGCCRHHMGHPVKY